MNLDHVDKEELYQYYRKQERRSQKYRWKFTQVVNAYKELERERDKLRVGICTDRPVSYLTVLGTA